MRNLYSNQELFQSKSRLSGRILELFGKGFWPEMEFNQQQRLSQLTFDFPLRGQAEVPFEYYAFQKNQQKYIQLPILSLIFLEDLCTAYAWLWRKNYSFKTIDKYVTMLRVGLDKPPLVALQIPNNALKDPQTDELSLRFRNSAFAFILAHEMGHHYYEHNGYSGLTSEKAQQNEKEADSFAIALLSQVANIPMGMIIWFQATAYFQPNRGQFNSDEDWQKYLDKEGTHPLTPDRLRQVSDGLMKYKDRFVRNEHNKINGLETIRFIAGKVKEIAEILEDTEIQIEMQEKAKEMDLSSLAPRYEGNFF